MAFAIVELGGKQYKVEAGSKLKVEKLDTKLGDKFVLDKVLLYADGEDVKIGTPYVEGVKIEGKVLEQGKDKTKIVFKYHSKTRYRKKKGHRQPYSGVEVVSMKV
ncbi:50S ribosomal protein L21 [Candidatus Wolfebacteria bacterium]|nr:50S ribosomal protein L21 [Candidatus Wolfebacteria bacterium]